MAKTRSTTQSGRRCAAGLALGLLSFALPLSAGAPRAARAGPEEPAIDGEALMAHVRRLAGDDLAGRGSWKTRDVASRYVGRHFASAGLQVLPGADSMYFETKGVKEPALRNVAAWLPVGAKPAEEYVIVSAHYDHLGRKTTKRKEGESTIEITRLFPGADDNATGVAALLELARVLVAAQRLDPASLERSIVFVAFDLEEERLRGSEQWVSSPPPGLPLAACAAFLTMDMLGRSMADMVPGSLFLMGTESCAALRDLVRVAPQPEDGRKLVLGIDFQPGYSDYEPFRKRRVPYVFVTSGACRDYHQPGDTADRVDAKQLLARTRWIRRLVPQIANLPERPAWRDGVEPDLAEIRDLRYVIGKAQEAAPEVEGLPPMAGLMLKNYAGFLDRILEAGVVTTAQRDAARNSALTLFKLAVVARGR